MECNKEEAVRAQGMAESLMQKKDFNGARRIALRAQKLYHDLENISQMLMVCDVQCAADVRLFGNETDWYGILQIEQTADEAMIKKQYRKFAFQLHPDKNKLPGAEDAFKLIGEAQRVLLDQGKRSMHDLRRRAFVSKPAASYRPAQSASCYPHVGVQNNLRSIFTGLKPRQQQPQQKAQPVDSICRPAFWTMCPFCTVRYKYYREVINKPIRCQKCNKPFIAYEMSGQGTPPATNSSQPAFSQQKGVPNPGACKVEQRCQGNLNTENSKQNCFPKTGCTTEVGTEKVSKRKRKQVVESSESSESCDTGSSTDYEEDLIIDEKVESSESSESCDTGSSTDSEEDLIIDENGHIHTGQDFGSHGEQWPRRSGRRKQQVSYKENLSDDDDLVSHPKRAKGSGSSCAIEEESGDAVEKEASEIYKESDVKEDPKEVKQRESACFEETLPNGKKGTEKLNKNEEGEVDDCKTSSEASADECKTNSEAHADECNTNSEAHADAYKKICEAHDATSDSSSRGPADPELFVCPDPDFNNFDKVRKEECFAVGQTWAIYDTVDAMPRFYARIRKVFSPGFKLRITWLELEPDPDDKNGIQWIQEELPVSCGKFKHGNSENTEDRLMFSHLICWEKGGRRDTYKIFPRKGETWALFKNWDIKWSSYPDSHRKYEHEFVEILSEYAEGLGTSVAYLSKVKGFASVFCRIVKEGMDIIQIASGELFRFSHRVPSFKLTGEEREGVPKGSFELDPASLPANLEETPVPVDLRVDDGDAHPSNWHLRSSLDELKPEMMSKGGEPMHQVDLEAPLNLADDRSGNDIEDCSATVASTPEPIEIPYPEFYNFDADKTQEKFQIGQIWSLYSDEDGLPKYYGKVNKIEIEPDFKLHVSWLVACSLTSSLVRWHDKTMPICCGRFKIKEGGSQAYSQTTFFSHQLRAEPADWKNEYTIFPKKGEAWAMYRNWSAEIKCLDSENCEYDIVEVIEENYLHIQVLVLDRVDGFNSVFKALFKDRSPLMRVIPRVELLRFSHQIPAFRLTEEIDGSLRGFWELDPAALPVHYFCYD